VRYTAATRPQMRFGRYSRQTDYILRKRYKREKIQGLQRQPLPLLNRETCQSALNPESSARSSQSLQPINMSNPPKSVWSDRHFRFDSDCDVRLALPSSAAPRMGLRACRNLATRPYRGPLRRSRFETSRLDRQCESRRTSRWRRRRRAVGLLGRFLDLDCLGTKPHDRQTWSDPARF
jgi:hypothetical protein